jgi:hypothetical protein
VDRKTYPAHVAGYAFCLQQNRVFDIVNGFLIDAVAHGLLRLMRSGDWCGTRLIIWLRFLTAPLKGDQALCRPVVDGVDSQA